jgi:hypothetical protein
MVVLYALCVVEVAGVDPRCVVLVDQEDGSGLLEEPRPACSQQRRYMAWTFGFPIATRTKTRLVDISGLVARSA